MSQENEIRIDVPLWEIQDMIKLITKIQFTDVTYNEDMLVLAQQALRLNKMNANDISETLYKWAGCANQGG